MNCPKIFHRSSASIRLLTSLPRLRSGWSLSAAFRYAFRMSCAEDPLSGTPNSRKTVNRSSPAVCSSSRALIASRSSSASTSGSAEELGRVVAAVEDTHAHLLRIEGELRAMRRLVATQTLLSLLGWGAAAGAVGLLAFGKRRPASMGASMGASAG